REETRRLRAGARSNLRPSRRRLLRLPEWQAVLGRHLPGHLLGRRRIAEAADPPVTVSLVDYGLGNLGSVSNMLKRVGAESRRVSTVEEIRESEKILLPGIGSFDHGMALLRDAGLDDALRDFAVSGRPLFGICLGMQLLLDSSE